MVWLRSRSIAGGAGCGKCSDQYLEFDTERAVCLYCPSIASSQGKLVLQRSGCHERVVYRIPRNSKLGNSTQESTGRRRAQKSRLGEVAAEKAEYGARCTADRWW
jgi:hypothetical protein